MLRSSALKIIRGLGIEGGCNVQYALDPESFQYYVIEVNPRVSRSSALASKATGYPIARVAAKVAIGKRLDEIPNQVTGQTLAAFEPALDYCVVKIPRWPFDKFPTADRSIGTQMKATGEVMAIERTFEAALMKAMRSLEQKAPALDGAPVDGAAADRAQRPAALRAAGGAAAAAAPTADRGDGGHRRAARDDQHRPLVPAPAGPPRRRSSDSLKAGLEPGVLREAKVAGFTDRIIADLSGESIEDVRAAGFEAGLRVAYKLVDTCAAEFAAATPYYYSTYEAEDESPRRAAPGGRSPSVLVLGSGPIRIGQGIEFDYCSVQAAMALREAGWASAMLNSNPETVSTDFDTCDRLYFDPLDEESAENVIRAESAQGVVVQFGGQTAINLAEPLAKRGATILGSSGRRHRPGRGPPPLRGDPPRDRDPPAAGRHRHQRRGGPGHRRPRRLPGAGAAQLRAGRPGDGDRARRRGPRALPRGRPRRAGPRHHPGRQVPRRRRVRGRRHLRRRAGPDPRDHGARRARRRPLRRLLRGLPGAAPERRGHRAAGRLHPPDRAAAQDRRACSTSSTCSTATGSTSSRSTRAPAAPCPSSARSPGCRWCRWRWR